MSCWWGLLVNDFKQGSGLTSFVCYLVFSVICVCLGNPLPAPLQRERQALDLARLWGPCILATRL